MTGPATLANRIDYHATNARGVTIRTFASQDHAREWVKANAPDHDGLVVEEITVTVTRRRVYRPKPAQRVGWNISQGAMA